MKKQLAVVVVSVALLVVLAVQSVAQVGSQPPPYGPARSGTLNGDTGEQPGPPLPD